MISDLIILRSLQRDPTWDMSNAVHEKITTLLNIFLHSLRST